MALLQAAGRWPDAVQLCLDQDLLQSLRGVCSELVQQPNFCRSVERPKLVVRAAGHLVHGGHADEGIALLIACGLPEEVSISNQNGYRKLGQK